MALPMFTAVVCTRIVAVPLGVLCAVKRGRWTDRLISFGLFLLYSVPPFVAGAIHTARLYV